MLHLVQHLPLAMGYAPCPHLPFGSFSKGAVQIEQVFFLTSFLLLISSLLFRHDGLCRYISRRHSRRGWGTANQTDFSNKSHIA